MISESVSVVLSSYFSMSVSLLHDRNVNLYERPKCELVLFVCIPEHLKTTYSVLLVVMLTHRKNKLLYKSF